MARKKITILAVEDEISRYFKQQIETVFQNLFDVDYRSSDMEAPLPITETDLVLYTDPLIFNQLAYLINVNAPVLMMRRTITREALQRIKELPAGWRILVGNLNEYMANEMTALILQLGVTHLKLQPFYPDAVPPKSYDGIIAPTRYPFLPDTDQPVIETGNRVYDISLILDILSLLQVEHERSEEIMYSYMSQVPNAWHGIEYAWENRRVLINQWKVLLDEITAGVVVCNDAEQIELVNSTAEELLDETFDNLVGRPLDVLSWKDPGLKNLLDAEEVSNEVVSCQAGDIVISVKPVVFGGQPRGRMVILHPYHEVLQVQQQVRQKLTSPGYVSRHHFSDLIGRNPRFLEARWIAEKIAPSDSTVLLFGESGTGKELFAGAIHNRSRRRKAPFIAINCATLPENLLETELFGYAEGAFTGARKGGRRGLFELADDGTLFLDEIGDLPQALQARLLRALEEKEIRRVGGDTIVAVDVRVIAATNRNLPELVDQGLFRRDLFHRLNVFQITIPPLRDRADDIWLLIEHFMNELSAERHIGEDFRTFCLNYDWPGNIRELRNVLEYATTINHDALSFQALPDYLRQRSHYVDRHHRGQYLLLKLIFNRQMGGMTTGRRSLREEFCRRYYPISEMEVREHLEELRRDKLIRISRGRNGTAINEEGIQELIKRGVITAPHSS